MEWKPPFLWLTGLPPYKGQLSSPHLVVQAPSAGVYSYQRHPGIEKLVLANQEETQEGLAQVFVAVEQAYAALKEGRRLNIIGIGGDGLQTEPVARKFTQVGEFK